MFRYPEKTTKSALDGKPPQRLPRQRQMSRLFESSSTLPSRSTRTDRDLVGLLTCASPNRNCLPKAFMPQWLDCSDSRRLQWRGRAGFSPASQIHQAHRVISRGQPKVKVGNLSGELGNDRPLYLADCARLFRFLSKKAGEKSNRLAGCAAVNANRWLSLTSETPLLDPARYSRILGGKIDFSSRTPPKSKTRGRRASSPF